MDSHTISLSLFLSLTLSFHTTGIPGHEFPQPYDLVIESSDSITSGGTPVQFFQSRTFIMVGQIPVQFGKSTHSIAMRLQIATYY